MANIVNTIRNRITPYFIPEKFQNAIPHMLHVFYIVTKTMILFCKFESTVKQNYQIGQNMFLRVCKCSRLSEQDH